MKKRIWKNAGIVLFCLLLLFGMPAKAQERNLQVEVQKRVEWLDEQQIKVTLDYKSNSGVIRGTKDMNFILIQDKSGSMDGDYGFHLQLEYDKKAGYPLPEGGYFPIQNSNAWSESADVFYGNSAAGRSYRNNLNTMQGGCDNGCICNTSTYYNAPCQMEDHYYLSVDNRENGQSAGVFIHGNNLYTIEGTDLHHYKKLSSREEALVYLEQGRRVVRSSRYYDESGVLRTSDTAVYFLDISHLYSIDGKLYLGTLDTDCRKNDRMALTQQFMKNLVEEIRQYNQNNQIAYIPFWGDVPTDGTWVNRSGNAGNTALSVDTYSPQITKKEGVTAIPFKEAAEFDQIIRQIEHPFTYNGTNWSIALQRAVHYLEERTEKEKQKETLVIFLTDGVPQGSGGKSGDIMNPEINGVLQSQKLKEMEGVNLYACGVCINQKDGTIMSRLNDMDTYGDAVIARTSHEIHSLFQKIEKRMKEEYEEIIYGYDGFFVDQLTEDVELSKDQMDETWSILETAEGEKHGTIPMAVYEEAKKEKETIYVKNTRTIYWYVSKLTNGDYEEKGHRKEYILTDQKAAERPPAKMQTVTANGKQLFQYTSSANANETHEILLETPELIWSKKDCQILLNYELNGICYDREQTGSFVCKQDGKEVSRLTVTIPAGKDQGTGQFEKLLPGEYEILELDKAGKEIPETAQKVTLEMTKEIQTREKSEEVPPSVTTSEEKQPKNHHNLFSIQGEEKEIVFSASYDRLKGNLKVVKEIDGEDGEIWWDHGNPTFLIQLKGKGLDGNTYCFTHVFEFTKEYVKSHEKNGVVRMEYVFQDLPISEAYQLKEFSVSRYALKGMQGNGDHIKILEAKGEEETEPIYAQINLKAKPEGSAVSLKNEKKKYDKYSHNAFVENKIL